MSSTPQTGGFQVSVVPQFQGINPALFNGAGALGAGLDAGISGAGRLYQIHQASLMAPLQQDLLKAQLQHQRLANQLQDITLPAATAEAARKTQEAKLPIQSNQSTFQDLDENGNLVEYQARSETDPETGAVTQYTGIPLRTLKTKDQLALEHELTMSRVDYYKNRGVPETQRDVEAYQDAVDSGDAEAAEFYKARLNRLSSFNTGKNTVKTYPDENNNVYRQIIGPDGKPVGDPEQVFTDAAKKVPAKWKPAGVNLFGALTGGGASAAVPAATPGAIDTAALTNLASQWSGGTQPTPVVTPAAPAIAATPSGLQGNDLLAYQWAKSNPTDPRAVAILARLGIR